jgi:hypothetical protein
MLFPSFSKAVYNLIYPSTMKEQKRYSLYTSNSPNTLAMHYVLHIIHLTSNSMHTHHSSLSAPLPIKISTISNIPIDYYNYKYQS